MTGLLDVLRPWRHRAESSFPARIRVEGFGTLPVVVVAGNAIAVALRLPSDPPVPVRFLHRREAVLHREQGAEEDGVVVAVPAPNGQVHEDRLDFLRDGLHSQRREFVRVPVVVPVTVSKRVATDRRKGWTVDLSGGGALLAGLEEAQPGERIRVGLDLDSDFIVAEAAVLRVTDRGMRAVRLEAATEEQRERIVAWVTARQRDQLRARGGQRR